MARRGAGLVIGRYGIAEQDMEKIRRGQARVEDAVEEFCLAPVTARWSTRCESGIGRYCNERAGAAGVLRGAWKRWRAMSAKSQNGCYDKLPVPPVTVKRGIRRSVLARLSPNAVGFAWLRN
jgi:hypothetical protein